MVDWTEQRWLWKMANPAILVLPCGVHFRILNTRRIEMRDTAGEKLKKTKRKEPHKPWESRRCSPIFLHPALPVCWTKPHQQHNGKCHNVITSAITISALDR